MNPPRLLRPLRPFLQGQLPLRPSQVAVPRASTQFRTNATTTPAEPADAAPKAAPKESSPKADFKPSTKADSKPNSKGASTKDPIINKLEELSAEPESKISRMPRSLEALYLQPLRREAPYGQPTCDLQLRSYSVRNLEFFCDFALRAAYYLGLPAFGPIPLPRQIERWTVPKSTFIFKKSQENFERITLRRLIQIKDGHPEAVQVWLAFLQKHAYYGIGMKANVWEFSKIDFAQEMEKNIEETKKLLEDKWQHMGHSKTMKIEDMQEFMANERRKISGGRITPATHQHRSFASSRSATTTTTTTTTTSTTSQPRIIFSGIQPTGVPHLGNYLGALQQWKRMQDDAASSSSTSQSSTKLIFSIVDLHAITIPKPSAILRQQKREMLAALLAIGLDPSLATIFYQSSVPAHSELQWILSCTASTGYLSRMTQWKSKLSLSDNATISSASSTLKHGLFSYPILQAADILVHRATHVPVGADQRQHLEFARECVTNFNSTFNTTALVQPETMTSDAGGGTRVMSLADPTKKMSKSDPNSFSRILITDDAETIFTKFKRAKTDNLQDEGIAYDKTARPGVANLLEILAAFASSSGSSGKKTAEELAREMKDEKVNYKDLKERTARAVIKGLEGVREKYLELLDGEQGRRLDEIAEEGGEKARESAEETMKAVRDAVGLGI
ncbi:mitochondrial tryptophan--tRNA ligase [Cladorrhinum sp. PSN259]|nr:mitochondrial tryptophan--tRNA ligase [Cladorrhinum sp. PSN259]